MRYADDIVCGFKHEVEAWRFMAELKERFKQFDLTMHEQKTRLLQFGRFAAQQQEKRGLGKPETFNFLGFTQIWGRARSGAFQLKRKTRSDRMRAKLKDIKEGLRRKMHESVAIQGQWLQRVYRGYCAYRAVPTNLTQLRAFRYHIVVCWWRLLRRRSQKDLRMKGAKRKFTLEFREEAGRLVVQERVTVLEAARRLQISDKTLANWVRAARQGKMPRAGARSKGPFGERS